MVAVMETDSDIDSEELATTKNKKYAGVVDSHDDRPTAKAAFPFRFHSETRNGFPVLVIECDGPLPHSSGTSVYRIEILDPDNALVERQEVPWGYRIREAARLFWELQAQVDGLMRDRDEAVTEKRLLEGRVKSLEAQVLQFSDAKRKSGK